MLVVFNNDIKKYNSFRKKITDKILQEKKEDCYVALLGPGDVINTAKVVDSDVYDDFLILKNNEEIKNLKNYYSKIIYSDQKSKDSTKNYLSEVICSEEFCYEKD